MQFDELKEIMLVNQVSGERTPSGTYKKAEVDSAIAELKAENERLKKCEIWMKQHFFCEEVIACESAKNRRLKRALYKACANWAHHRVFVRFKTNEKAWENVERKCRAKAEEYK